MIKSKAVTREAGYPEENLIGVKILIGSPLGKYGGLVGKPMVSHMTPLE